MNIRGIPTDYDVFERFNKDYEREHYRFTEANRRVGAATRELFASWFPRFLAPVVRSAIYALLDDRLIEAFGFPQPSPIDALAGAGCSAFACRVRAFVAAAEGTAAAH